MCLFIAAAGARKNIVPTREIVVAGIHRLAVAQSEKLGLSWRRSNIDVGLRLLARLREIQRSQA